MPTTSSAMAGTSQARCVRPISRQTPCSETPRRANQTQTAETARPSRTFASFTEMASVPEAVLEERPHGREAVLPRDLLPLVVGAPVVADRQLVDPEAATADLGGQLRLDAEVGLAQRLGRAQHLERESLVARLPVRQRRVVEDVREQREEAVAGLVPEEVHALRPPAAQPRAVDDVGVALQDRRDQGRDVGGVVLEV